MRTRYLTADELRRLQAVTKDQAWLPFAVSLSTGLRIGDVLKIKTSDIENGGVTYVSEKTGKRGHAQLDDDLLGAITPIQSASPWCFPSPQNPSKHLTRQAAWARMKSACRRAGVDPRGVSPHSLRKVFAVELLRKTNLAEVQKALQHDRAGTTEVYAFSDWTTGENAKKPLLRGDILHIIGQMLSIFGINLDGRGCLVVK